MAWIDFATSYHPLTGTIVNHSPGQPEIFNVRAKVTNNLPWELADCEFHLKQINGPAKLVGTDPLPQILKGENIAANGGKREKEFVLESTGTGNVDIQLELKWKLDGTNLTYPITATVSLAIVGG